MGKQYSFRSVKGFLAAAMLMLFAGITVFAQSQNTAKKVLIVYFSQPLVTENIDAVSGASVQIVGREKIGNVELAAKMIQRASGGDLFAIQTQRPYPQKYQALADYAKQEGAEKRKPPLARRISNIADYDTVFIGYPIWWYTMPMAITSFLEEYDFAGKTIIPFCVHGGSGWADSIEKITALESRATVSKNGLLISRNNIARSESDISAAVRRLGLAK
ncbi:flavodoxin [Breznakiellaceae bacterium SP9]